MNNTLTPATNEKNCKFCKNSFLLDSTHWYVRKNKIKNSYKCKAETLLKQKVYKEKKFSECPDSALLEKKRKREWYDKKREDDSWVEQKNAAARDKRKKHTETPKYIEIDAKIQKFCENHQVYHNADGWSASNRHKHGLGKCKILAKEKNDIKKLDPAWVLKQREHSLASSRRNKHKIDKDKNKARSKLWYEKNKNKPEQVQKKKIKGAKYRADNPEKLKEYSKKRTKINGKKYKEDPEYRAKVLKWGKGWKGRKKYRSSPEVRLASNLRTRLRRALKGTVKKGSAVSDLGCTVEFLKEYLESKFQEGMTWDNYGPRGWHLDHIQPLSAFDLSIRENIIIVCHYTNLQPLWASDNISKGGVNRKKRVKS